MMKMTPRQEKKISVTEGKTNALQDTDNLITKQSSPCQYHIPLTKCPSRPHGGDNIESRRAETSAGSRPKVVRSCSGGPERSLGSIYYSTVVGSISI